ncbi:Fe-S protein assembly co-chaperone HscB [Lonepinella koalarum]|uniref:Co-chaperone protein HscB homolog n=1 Tax=Lonepinella koalarum TaxID=53417 RepID=A0A4R1KJQ0_9PAST|nr:Fe-S protein assembly co-chaperone HscB [Lonepinella koalarum]MDH2927405.1 co-chaperone HscB [Lonepinella koalarum]TCK64962.1 co-chaperone protein HscB [Lonepinella koalarum]TFJ88859.1 Fe-S protein assembly co-chaperone HscB [Lonepinella koalarum]TYG35520.1 Fe-S protein assembly co-chaperone HscB [Lonepinella koalarum]
MTNPFSLFKLPVQFEIDQTLLSEHFLQLQKQFHPDNFATQSTQEQRLAMQQSAEINDALKTLKDPILRAEAIIQIHTGEVQDLEQKSTQDMAFLMQQLQWREQLEEIETNKDDTALDEFRSDIEAEQKILLNQLKTELTQSDWSSAQVTADKLRFIKKLIEQIEMVEEKLF